MVYKIAHDKFPKPKVTSLTHWLMQTSTSNSKISQLVSENNKKRKWLPFLCHRRNASINLVTSFDEPLQQHSEFFCPLSLTIDMQVK